MDRTVTLLLGITLTFASSWLGLVFAPYVQMNNVQPIKGTTDDGVEEMYPRPLEGEAAYGREVYIANGCMYCHSQQIRSEHFGNGADIKRNWGVRRTVQRDYIYEKPILLGTMRTGPDLANVARRWSGQGGKDWNHLHLYAPRMMMPGSLMPSFAFLYEKRRITGEPSADALKLQGEWAPEPGYEIVPTPQAKALVEYLSVLDHNRIMLPEAQE